MSNFDCIKKFGFDDFANVTAFSSQQLSNYCSLYAEFDRYNSRIDATVGISMALTGALGFVNYVLTYLTFCKGAAFNGPSFIYHKAMALAELCLMAIMFQYGVLRSLKFPGGYSTIVWANKFWGGWVFGDAIKLFVLSMTAFVSCERIIAVWFPMKFHFVDRLPVVASSIAISAAIGSLHLVSIAGVKVVQSDAEVFFERTEFGNSIAYGFIDDAIPAIKMGLGMTIMAMCVTIVCGMVVQQKKTAHMTTDARNNWKRIKMACYLQLILAITTLIDQASWVAFKFAGQPYPIVGIPAVRWMPYDASVVDLSRMRWRLAFETTQVFTGELDHGARFFFYLIFHKCFREAFCSLFGWAPAGSSTRVHVISPNYRK